MNTTGQSSGQIREMEQSLASDQPDSVRLATLIKLSEYYLSPGNSKKLGEVYISKALELCREQKIPVPYRLRWLNARLLRASDMVHKAILEMEGVISYLEGVGNFQVAAEARNYLASLVLFSGDFNASIDLCNRNISIAREKKLTNIIPVACLGIANVYGQSVDTMKRRKYLQLFLDEAKAEHNPRLTADAYLRLGAHLMGMDSNLSVVMPYLRESLNINVSLKDSLSVMTTLNMMGWFFYVKKEQDSSLAYYLRSVGYCPPSYLNGFAKPYENIATIYRDKEEYKKALFYYDLCRQYAQQTRDFYVLAGMYEDMSDMAIRQGDYRQAYEYYVAFKQTNDSLNAGKYMEGLGYARARFDAETKEKELQLLNLKLDQQVYFTYGFSGFILLLLIIGILLFFQAKSAARRKLSEMNHRLSEITHANLRQQMNPHFIFNTLNSIQYYMYQHDKIATNNYLTKFSRLIRKILENSQHTLVTVKDELDVIQLYLELETLRFKDKFTFSILIDEEIDTMTCKLPTMLIQPYVENAVCHGLINKEGKGVLTIGLTFCGDYICCRIEDNGIGREAAREIRRRQETLHHSLGTKITESRIGIMNALYGTNLKVTYTDLKDDKNRPCGTLVELQLPLMT